MQQLLGTFASLQPVCHGVCFKVEIGKFDTKICMLMDQLDQCDSAVHSGYFQKHAQISFLKVALLDALQSFSGHAAQRHCLVQVDRQSSLFQTVQQMSNPSQQHRKVLRTAEFIVLTDIVSKGCNASLQPVPRAMFMQSSEDLNEIQCP